MTDPTDTNEDTTAETKRTRELNPVTVAIATADCLTPVETFDSQIDAGKWIREYAAEGVQYTMYRELGKRLTLKIETIRRFEEG